MVSVWALMFSLLLACVTTAHGVTINSTADVKITASPGEMLEGFTKHMTVNCTFMHEQSSDFSTLMSLILSKTDSLEDDVFTEVAAISSNSPNAVQVKNSLGAQVTGQLSVNDSVITFEWLYPSSQAEGRYKCEAYGMDDTGHPRTSAATVNVEERVVDFNKLFLERLKDLDLAQDALNGRLQDLETRVNNSRDATMLSSAKYGGHTYYVSSIYMSGHAASQRQCVLYGGYLVEINGQPEYDFIVEFLNNNTINDYTIVGAENLSGTYTYMHSGQPIAFFKWQTGHPRNDHCMYLEPSAARAMHDSLCYAANYQHHFLCEMPF